MHESKRRERGAGRGAVGEIAVAGVKDRASNRVAARPVPGTTSGTLTGFIAETAEPDAGVFTDELASCKALESQGYDHETVAYSVKEYVRGEIHTNGVESMWSMLKRGFIGVYHRMSPAHLHRYINEFCGRHNIGWMHTLDQMAYIVTSMTGKQLRYHDLISTRPPTSPPEPR